MSRLYQKGDPPPLKPPYPYTSTMAATTGYKVVNTQEVLTLLSKMRPIDRMKLLAQFCRECGEANDNCACRDERI